MDAAHVVRASESRVDESDDVDVAVCSRCRMIVTVHSTNACAVTDAMFRDMVDRQRRRRDRCKWTIGKAAVVKLNIINQFSLCLTNFTLLLNVLPGEPADN